MRSFQQKLDELTAREVRMVAISTDAPEETHKLLKQEGYTFTFLSDSKAELTRKWNLLDPNAARSGQQISLMAEFLIDSTRTVRWINRIEGRRATGDQLLKILDELKAQSPQKP